MNFRGKIKNINFFITGYNEYGLEMWTYNRPMFELDMVKSFRHIGKTTFIIEELNPISKGFLKKLFKGRFDFYEAIFTCFFLNGILSTDWEGIHLSMWSPHNTDHLICNSVNQDCNSEEWTAIERLQNSKCNAIQIPTLQAKKVHCFDRYAFGCSKIQPLDNYYLRGMSRHLQFIDRHYFRHFENDSTSFYGSKNTFIRKINSTWFIGILPSTILGFYNGSKNYPRGTNTWFIHFEEYGHKKLEECLLSFSWCDGKKFVCDNGRCISFDKICDGNPDCLNYEDEKNCSIVETSFYRKEFPPSAYEINSKTSIRLMFHLNSINYVDEMNNLININFGITLTWNDPRLKFNFIFRHVKYLSEEEKQKLWIPELIFKIISGEDNTFIHQGQGNVFVETNFSRDDIDVKVEELYPKAYINGSNTNISYSFRHNININCFFQFHYYPFDTQICHLRIVLPTQYGNKVHFHSEPSITYDKITLLQLKLVGLTIKSLEADDIVVTMTFTRIFNNIFWTTYVPIFFLQIVSILTLLLPRKKFATSIMITLTTTLVMYSLYQIVSISLPATSYNKMIDYWLLFALMTQFFTFTIQATIEVWEPLKCRTTQNHILITFILKYGQALLISAIFIFDSLYWMINLISYYSKNNHHNTSLYI
nr:uncharacterized protein LOC121124803 [Lepeophtheirus salmonis]